ncbi:MAG TPA: outer membrane protein assembly factor BamD [Bryobacteraceae bacterium]|nr:outer membrane protein assembly factor BamD [Bryobacteraceae bacterium]
MTVGNCFRYAMGVGAVVVLLSSCGLKRHPYDNPISKDTQQPDKVLFDKAVNDLEHSRFEIARLTLQTLINTYDSSEYLAKAKLAIADSWYREGGAHGLAQAEAEYKDFILFYPTMEESAEAQEKVCDIHYRQMDKPDRDQTHVLRAEDECRQLLIQFPNSKYAPMAQQKLRNIQEMLAAEEFGVGNFYHNKGSFPAAANRLQSIAEQFPLYSKADEALWLAADSYSRMGDRFENQQVADYSKIVKDYPLSPHADEAKEKLQAMNRPVPDADPAAYAHMQYELENRQTAGMPSKFLGAFKTRPDVRMAAKSGTPAMDPRHATTPVSVPPPATGTGVTDVQAAVVTDTTALDKNPDARANPPGQAGAAGTAASGSTAPTDNAAAQQQFPPTNHPLPKKKKSKKNQPDSTPAATSATTPAATTPAAAPDNSAAPAKPQQ